jgi:DnaJ-class molecular chaperone
LGVARDASQDEIRKAYRQLAKKYHPDLNPGKADVAEKFAEISEAYELLGTEEARAGFEQRQREEAQFREQARQRSFYRDTQGRTGRYSQQFEHDFGDVFSQFFSSSGSAFEHQQRRGSDVQYTLEVSFEEAVRGGTRRIELPNGRKLDVKIPSGIESGTRLRFAGQGLAGDERTRPGDAYIEIHVAPSSRYRRVGNDLETTVPISLQEAILGAKVPVETPSGRLNVTVAAGTSSGQKLRLKGKGITSQGKTGDLLIETIITLPPVIDEELKELVQSWSANHPYNPRDR